MKTKSYLLGMVIVTLAVILTACGGESTSLSTDTEEQEVSATPAMAETETDTLADMLPDNYDDALSARNQLMLGTLHLEEADDPITPAQAQTLSLLWQAYKALGADDMAASEELTAVQAEIMAAMTDSQLAAIREMQLTNVALRAFYTEQGLEMPAPDLDDPDAAATSTQRGKNMTEEERAAMRAEDEASGTSMPEGGGGMGSGAARRDVLIDTVITLLTARAE
ncbi:MAG: hypothetical protein U9Q70_00100 [Chloroflexota bacterium]|nr:hypothetical protein [Chloroflexota bacterium]